MVRSRYMLPLAGALQRGRDASEQAFARAMQQQAADAAQAAVDRELSGLRDLQKLQDAQVADLQESYGRLADLLTIQNEATATLQQTITELNSESQALNEKVATAQTELLQGIAEAGKQAAADTAAVRLQLEAWLEKLAAEVGVIVWSYGDMSAIAVLCDGREVPRQRYPDLATLMWGITGEASSADNFCVPDIPANPSYPECRAWIRF